MIFLFIANFTKSIIHNSYLPLTQSPNPIWLLKLSSATLLSNVTRSNGHFMVFSLFKFLVEFISVDHFCFLEMCFSMASKTYPVLLFLQLFFLCFCSYFTFFPVINYSGFSRLIFSCLPLYSHPELSHFYFKFYLPLYADDSQTDISTPDQF